MRVRDERGFSLWMIIASIVAVFVLLFVVMYLMDNGSPPDAGANPECPHAYQELALSAQITDIPEFHDCQKLISEDGKTYGTLAGVFARFQLDSLNIPTVYNDAFVLPEDGTTEGPTLTAGPIPGVRVRTTTQLLVIEREIRARAVAVGEVLSWNGPYGPLGVAQGMSCLFVVRVARAVGAPHSYRALMVNVSSDQACLGQAPSSGGTWLRVSHLAPSGGTPYPPVARWDWDEANRRQFIGILCQPDWCEVGDPTTVPPTPRDVSLATPAEEIPWEHKGRYDEQRLAIPNTGGGLIPSQVLATASPHANLGSYGRQQFYGDWLPVASTVLPTAIELYRTKFNFGQGSVPGVTNQVSLCAGSRMTCLGWFQALMTMFTIRCWKSEDENPKNWWARIVSSNGTTAYRCVTRRIHPGVDPPAAARWRWKMNDEGLWTRCGEGCCEVQEE